MRGGALALFAWAVLNALLLGTDWFWTHNGLEVAETAFTVFSILAWGIVLTLRRRDSIRTGPPDVEDRPEALPTASLGAVMFAWGIAALVFGFQFGHFLIYFGIGLAVVALGVLARERHGQRSLLHRWTSGERR